MKNENPGDFQAKKNPGDENKNPGDFQEIATLSSSCFTT